MDNQQERVEARKALQGANLPYVIDGNTGDLMDSHLETVADFFYHDEDIHLCANAPTWLRNSLDREEQLIAEIYRLGKERNAYKISKDAYKESYEKYSEALKGAKTTNLELARKVAEQDKKLDKAEQFNTGAWIIADDLANKLDMAVDEIEQYKVKVAEQDKEIQQSRKAMIAALKHIDGSAQLFSHRDKRAVLYQLTEVLKLMNYPLPDATCQESDNEADFK